MPAEVDFEIVFVGQRVVDCLEERLSSQDLLAHLVHGVLDTGTLLKRKEAEGDVS